MVTVSVWLLSRSGLSSQHSERTLELNFSTRVLAGIPTSEITGVEMNVLYMPKSWDLSSHSSGSAIATVPLALLNCSRSWPPAVVAHQSRLAKLQPAHSVT